MKQGFSYIQLLVYISLFLILFTATFHSLFPLINKSLEQIQLLKEKKQLTLTLDTITGDIAFAASVEIAGTKVKFSKENIDYEYLLRNKRIVRKKTGYLYLTPKTFKIIEFIPKERTSSLYSLSIKTKNHKISRMIARRN